MNKRQIFVAGGLLTMIARGCAPDYTSNKIDYNLDNATPKQLDAMFDKYKSDDSINRSQITNGVRDFIAQYDADSLIKSCPLTFENDGIAYTLLKVNE